MPPKKAHKKVQLTQAQLLEPHLGRITAWQSEGLTLREIADRLDIEGINVDHNAVGRFCKKKGISTEPIEPMPPPASKSSPQQTLHPTPIKPVAPVSPPNLLPTPSEAKVAPKAVPDIPAIAPWQPPPRLYTPLAYGPWWTPDLALLHFGTEGNVPVWTLQDACEGTFITGATGSGKTSGSGTTIARSFLTHGFGGIILTVKLDDRLFWERMARECGRSEQLCIIEPNGRYRLNFMDYEARRPGVDGPPIENLVTLFYTVIEAHTRNQGNASAHDFWENAGRQLLRNVLRVLEQSRPRLSLEEIGHFLSDSPPDMESVVSGQWKTTRYFGPWLEKATTCAQGTLYERVIAEARRYWLEEFPRLASETRSCLVTGLTAMLDSFVEPAIHDLFCTDTSLIPEAALEGAIILVNLPLKRHKTVGLFSQMIWKHLFQEAVERRADPDDITRRPVFLWVDEAQFFYSGYDGLFQSTARSSRCATVYLTQNIPNFYGILSGAQSKVKVDGFLGNLNTKIFHCNNDPTTNVWAAEQIGKSLVNRFSSNSGSSRKSFWDIFPTENHSAGMQETIDYEVQPSEFTKLRTGGKQYDRLVDAYFVKSGARFAPDGKHYFTTVFQQGAKP